MQPYGGHVPDPPKRAYTGPRGTLARLTNGGFARFTANEPHASSHGAYYAH